MRVSLLEYSSIPGFLTRPPSTNIHNTHTRVFCKSHKYEYCTSKNKQETEYYLQRKMNKWHHCILRYLILQVSTHQLALCLSRATTTANAKCPQQVKKVAIIGAGISGLTLAHALRSSEKDMQISIFDSRRSLDFAAGSGGQFNVPKF